MIGKEIKGKELKRNNKFIDNKIITDIFRIQVCGSMCVHFGIGFIGLMLNNERLAGLAN